MADYSLAAFRDVRILSRFPAVDLDAVYLIRFHAGPNTAIQIESGAYTPEGQGRKESTPATFWLADYRDARVFPDFHV